MGYMYVKGHILLYILLLARLDPHLEVELRDEYLVSVNEGSSKKLSYSTWSTQL